MFPQTAHRLPAQPMRNSFATAAREEGLRRMPQVSSQPLALGLLLLLGYAGGGLARRLRLPAVAGYVLAGVAIGPSGLQLLGDSVGDGLGLVKDLGLGMVAMLIGAELTYRKIKKLGASIITIAVVQVITTFGIVYWALRYLLDQPFVVAALLASLATVTTPVATMAVIREYRAKGPFTTTLMGVIALDDVFCILAVGLSVGLILSMGTEAQALQWRYLIPPLLEVAWSIAAGIGIGAVSAPLLKRLKGSLEQLVAFLAIVFLNAGLAEAFELSALLMTMTAGVVIANLGEEQLFAAANNIDLPVFVAFFTLAGAGLHIDVLLSNWQIAAVYIVFRVIGKMGGCYLGGWISRAEENVRRHLGTAMLTKAGLSLGLLMYVQDRLHSVPIAALLAAVELAAISFYEIAGPIGVRHALFAVGEARHPGED